MSNFSALKTAIQNAIKQNGNEEITGNVLQNILISVVETLGDSAINTLETDLSNEATTRSNDDTQLNDLITGIKNNIDNGYVYAGIATPSTTPVSGKVFYIALQAGTYTNFGSQVVLGGITILKYNGSAWSKEQVLYTDGGVFDISAYNATGGELAKYANLTAALGTSGANIPQSIRKGGMSVKFVQSSDNKYIQARCMAQNFTTDTTQWQVVDDEPTAGSNNLVKSGGVIQYINKYLPKLLYTSSSITDSRVNLETTIGLNDYVFIKISNATVSSDGLYSIIFVNSESPSTKKLYIVVGSTKIGDSFYVVKNTTEWDFDQIRIELVNATIGKVQAEVLSSYDIETYIQQSLNTENIESLLNFRHQALETFADKINVGDEVIGLLNNIVPNDNFTIILKGVSVQDGGSYTLFLYEDPYGSTNRKYIATNSTQEGDIILKLNNDTSYTLDKLRVAATNVTFERIVIIRTESLVNFIADIYSSIVKEELQGNIDDIVDVCFKSENVIDSHVDLNRSIKPNETVRVILKGITAEDNTINSVFFTIIEDPTGPRLYILNNSSFEGDTVINVINNTQYTFGRIRFSLGNNSISEVIVYKNGCIADEIAKSYLLSPSYNEIFSIWDSLGSLGIWQRKLSELSGLYFDDALNSIMSIGGRFMLDWGYTEQCGFYAIKYLVDNHQERANKGIIYLENLHDRISGSITDTPYFVENNTHLENTYNNETDAIQAITNAISSVTPAVNSCITASYVSGTVVLEIINSPTSNGTFYVIEKVDNVETIRHGITVNIGDTTASILEQIASYEFDNYIASVVNNTVRLVKINTLNTSIGYDANGTGIAFSVTDNTGISQVARYFVSRDITLWRNTAYWKGRNDISLYSIMKGEIEYLQSNLPNAKIYFVMPAYSIIEPFSENDAYYYPDGRFNIDTWKNYAPNTSYSDGNKNYQDLIEITKKVGKLYGVEVLDIMNEGGISPFNWLSYYAYGDGHPIRINGEYPAYNLWANFLYKKCIL